MKALIMLGGMVLVALIITAGGDKKPETTTLTAETLGKDWPLTVSSAVVGCERGSLAYVETPDGTRYAANGIAQQRWPEVTSDNIWRIDEKMTQALGSEMMVDFSPILKGALAHCG